MFTCGTWQIFSVNVKKGVGLPSKTLDQARDQTAARERCPCVLSFQETGAWKISEMTVLEFVACVVSDADEVAFFGVPVHVSI